MPNTMNRLALSLVTGTLLVACNNRNEHATPDSSEAADNAPPAINYTVIKTYPHDTTAYTEGFLFHDGQLYESTGTLYSDMPHNRRSLFGSVDLGTGHITPKAELDKQKFFGEGIVFLHDKLYQLTYTTKIGFIYDAKTFKKIGEFTFPSKEGWGMTTDGKYLIMSDGSSNISYFDPDSTHPEEVSITFDDSTKTVKTLPAFKLVRTLSVRDNNGYVGGVNELELIKGYIYANQYTTNYILKIDPNSGMVVGKLNLDSLVNDARAKYSGAEVLNGIAYDSASGKVLITGKLWPNIYEIKFPL